MFLAIGYLGYMGFTSSATYYFTVAELIEQGNSIHGENVRVNGQVIPGSVEQEALGGMLKFTMADADGEESLPVVYQGVVPDAFRVDNEVVAEGHLDPDGIFQADIILVKCPSKYVPVE